MNIKLFTTTFVAIFVAELGDKTQLSALSLSAESRSPWTVFFASVLALATSSAIATFAGSSLSRWISPLVLARVAGVLFIVIGGVTLYRAR